jgi:hypothetical protein
MRSLTPARLRKPPALRRGCIREYVDSHGLNWRLEELESRFGYHISPRKFCPITDATLCKAPGCNREVSDSIELCATCTDILDTV